MKSNKLLAPVILTIIISAVGYLVKDKWINWDNILSDFIYDKYIKLELGPPKSEQIIYITITDNTYENFFRKNHLDRGQFAECLDIINKFTPFSVILDLIFAFPSDSISDIKFRNVLSNDIPYYLPAAFALSESKDVNTVFNINFPLLFPIELNEGKPYYAAGSLLQYDMFAEESQLVGHISDLPEKDDVYRHHITFIKHNNGFIPSLSLAVYLDYMKISPDSLRIEWGNSLILPATEDNWLNKDVILPIDMHGKTFIPFPSKWPDDFFNISLETIYNLYHSGDFQTLSEIIEGKFIIIGDISTGISDLAATPLNKKAPLITVQAAVLNSLLSKHFYVKIRETTALWFALLIIVIVFLLSLFLKKKLWFITIASLFCFLATVSVLLINLGIIVPIVSLLMPAVFYFSALSINMLIITIVEKRAVEEENKRRRNEFEEARKIQLSMLPKIIPQLKNLEIATYMKTATEVGGDYYDFYSTNDISLKIILSDATGHGLKAGTMVTVMKTLFTGMDEAEGLTDFLLRTSKNIKMLNLHLLYMCVLILKVENNKCTFTSAGMPPVFIYRKASNSVEKLLLKGMPLGSVLNYPYQIADTSLNSGDIVLLVSDGLTEMFDPDKELFGDDRVEDFLLNNSSLSPGDFISELKNVILNWTQTEFPSDDITVIVLKYKDS